MVKLYNSKPKRFFAFGCSSTKWYMNTWADIIARELGCKLNNPKQAECEYYNISLSGAGNFYIANAITEADIKYNFGPEDLVIVMWSRLYSEDRWIEKDWLTVGNIFTQEGYSADFVKNYANIGHFAIRDFMCIKLIDSLLQKTQHHHLQAVDIATYHIKQRLARGIISMSNNAITKGDTPPQKPKVLAKFHEQVKMYQPLLDKIQPSLFDILWDGDHKKNKSAIEPTIHPNFIDGHAHVKEHYEFACKTFDYPFDQQPIEQCYESWYKHIQDVYKNVDQPTLYIELVSKNLTKGVDFYGTPFSLI